ncbi:MAG: N-acetylmuramoyl-L-alanine amidase [Bacteroidia bacterium]|nr:N-acetylmuramoyl-L-alanine amidase [Bacteroidia bacterium]
MKTYTKILLDNGHGIDTPGKRSPDGTFLEYEFNRDIVSRVLRLADNYSADRGTSIQDKFVVLVPELEDVPLGNNGSKYDCRVRRANRIWETDPSVLLVSVHANAASNGEWKNAKGFGVFYDVKHGESIKEIAQVFADTIAHYSKDTLLHPYSMPVRGKKGLVETYMQYSIIAFPYCHSLLLELGFMDNKEEVEYLKSNEGREEIAKGIFFACVKALGLSD